MRNATGEFAVRREQLLDALGHAVHGLGQGGKKLTAGPRRAGVEIAVTQIAGSLAQGFEIAPDRAYPEPECDAENEAG